MVNYKTVVCVTDYYFSINCRSLEEAINMVSYRTVVCVTDSNINFKNNNNKKN